MRAEIMLLKLILLHVCVVSVYSLNADVFTTAVTEVVTEIRQEHRNNDTINVKYSGFKYERRLGPLITSNDATSTTMIANHDQFVHRS